MNEKKKSYFYMQKVSWSGPILFYYYYYYYCFIFTFILRNLAIYFLENNVDPNQLVFEEAIQSRSALFSMQI